MLAIFNIIANQIIEQAENVNATKHIVVVALTISHLCIFLTSER